MSDRIGKKSSMEEDLKSLAKRGLGCLSHSTPSVNQDDDVHWIEKK
jgi:hypothetical protein